MKTKVHLLLLSTALCALPFFSIPSSAESVTTTTTTKQTVPMGSTTINLRDFDMNQNGILSSNEVGEMLFKLFDTDSSNVIDSDEYEKRSILTVVPMEKQTTVSYDFDNDGIADKTQTTSEIFSQNTQLSRFGGNPDGLSPHEFLDKPYSMVDRDDTGGIDRTEWKTAYIFKIAPVPIN
jgi:hypothetical protein